MQKTIEKYLTVCSMNYKKTERRSALDNQIEAMVMAQVFEAKGLTREEVAAAFMQHLETEADDFPTIAHILKLAKPEPIKMYRMNSGPLGYAGLYPMDHWYPRQVARFGGDISRYLEIVKPETAKQMTTRANALVQTDAGEDERYEIESRAGTGFRLIRFDH